jgi:glycosyltransferase involved in cell wall biosynthesis
MKFLFIHQNFPAQFKNLAPALVRLGHDVTAFMLSNNDFTLWKGIKIIPYSLSRGNAQDAHPWTKDFESKVIRGEACLEAALTLKNSDYQPDIIIAHPGWGESLFLREVWPEAKLKFYCEFFYSTVGADWGFDHEFSTGDPASAGKVLLKNANMLLQFQYANSGICPTQWQANTFPKHIRDKITVIHDGIDTDAVTNNPNARLVLESGLQLNPGDEVVTFVSRTLEPLRGLHIFMRSLPKILLAKPNAQVLIVGAEGVGYGLQPPAERSWKELFYNEVTPLLSSQQRERIHFLGKIEYAQFITLLQVSSVHVYLTYPFVLSWSLLEAMSVGIALVVSDTPPVHEVITHRETGLFTNFFKPEELALSVIELLDDSNTRKRLGNAARELIIDQYDLNRKCLPKQVEWALR